MHSDEYPRLRQLEIPEGARWIYSAGFNVPPDLSSSVRVDAELSDLDFLRSAGARVAVLSHQGSYHDGTARPLGFVAEYIGKQLGESVEYIDDYPQSRQPRSPYRLRNGEIAVFGNTRREPGEQRNDPALAATFAELGDAVALGGFSKAHRSHASNVGVVSYRPGYVAESVLREIARLRYWAGAAEQYSVAVLGGIKSEKTLCGLDALTLTYDVIVPGGAVLNAVLESCGYRIGSSTLGDKPELTVRCAHGILSRRNRATIHIPDYVVVAELDDNKWRESKIVAVREGVDPGWMIVDFILQPWLLDELQQHPQQIRGLVAGTPCLYTSGFTSSADTILAALRDSAATTLLLGGDTVTELHWSGPISTGGGAALHYLAHGTLPVLEAARASVHPTTEYQR